MNRNYQLKAKKYLSTPHDEAFLDEVRDWLYSFSTYVESESEEKDSLAKLREVINMEKENNNISKGLLDFTTDYIITGFEDQLYRLCHCNYMDVLWGRIDDNCFSESSNSTLARDALGPKPNQKLHVAADCIIDHSEENNRKLQASAIDEMQKCKIRLGDESLSYQKARELSHLIIEECNNKAKSQFDSSHCYNCTEVLYNNNKIISLHTLDSNITRRFFLLRNNNIQKRPVISHRRPVYDRTRQIIAEQVIIDNVPYTCLKCSCGHFLNHLVPCRHVYALLDRPPVQEDFFPCCFKTYELNYGHDTEFTVRCDNITKSFTHFGGILVPSTIHKISVKLSGPSEPTSYVEAFHNIIDNNPFWDNHARVNKHNQTDLWNNIASTTATPTLTTKGKKNPYATNMPMYSHICDQIVTKEQQEYFQQALANALGGVMALGHTKTDKTQLEKGSLGTFDVVEKKTAIKKRKRECPVYSPSKYRK